MSKVLRWLVVVFTFCIAFGIALAAWHRLSKPIALTIAVGPPGFDDATLIAAWSRALSDGKAPVRLSIVSVSGPVEALEKLKKGEAQLAVVRSDGAASNRVRAVAILHKDPVAVVTLNKTKIDDFGDLKRKTLGIVGPPGVNDRLINTLQHHYHLSDETGTVPLAPGDISAAIQARLIDALLFVVPTTRGTKVGEGWTAIVRMNRKQLNFVPIDNAVAIAEASPAYEAGEIAAGQFGGAPALPDESVTTIQVATYLVADREVSNDTVTLLAHNLFEERQKISIEVPTANLVQAASTDKDAIFPIHPGAEVYYEGEETTLMERYGDWLFYGPMLLGVLGSVSVAAMRFLGLQQSPELPAMLSHVQEVISSIKSAQTIAELEAIQSSVDVVVAQLAADATRGSIDERQTGVIALAVTHIDRLLAEQRAILLKTEQQDTARSSTRQSRMV